MNQSKPRHFFRNAWRLAVLLAALFAASGARAADEQQPGRFLLIFETSPALKKNLPMVRQVLNGLFASNLQREIQANDDLAVWTADQALHTGTFPLASWSPADAEIYSERLGDFLDHQKYTRHASLAAVQPLLNRVAKNSERLTVLIFCDSQSRLLGTPYDAGVNDILTNATAQPNGAQSFYILVLRAYHGEYLGCSVNRSGPLNFPAFPPPPMPVPPPPVVNKSAPAPVAPVTAPPARVSGPVVSPVPALIIVGTNASTNASALVKPAASPVPETLSPATPTTSTPSTPAAITPAPTATPSATPTPAPSATPQVVAAPPANPAPIPNPAPPPPPAPVVALPKNSVPAPVPAVTPPASVAPASSPAVPAPITVAPVVAAAPATESAPAGKGYFLPLLIGGGALGVAAVLVIWLLTRTRRPQGSLITSSMRDDPRLPPRK